MTSKQIEDIAVCKIQEYFSYSHTLSPYISNNDKEPCWDGNIYVYNNKNKTNADLYGRIPVQVKGKTCKHVELKDFITYSVDLINLHNYKRDGGIVYFVVIIGEKDSIIYYEKLAPVDLHSYIKKCGGNKSIKIKLKPLKRYSSDIDNEFRDFCFNCKKQTGTISKIVNIEDVALNYNNLNFKFFVSGIDVDRVNIAQYLASHPVYLYVDIPNQLHIENLFPIGDGPVQLELIEKVLADVSINGNIYYSEFQRKFLSNGSFVIYIGNCLSINFKRENKSVCTKVDFKIKATKLHAWIKEAEFAIALLTYYKFEVNKQTINLAKKDYNAFKQWLEKELSFFLKVSKVFERLHVNEELNIQNLNESDKRLLDILIDAFYYKREVSIKEKLYPLLTIDIGNLCLALSCRLTPSGKYKLSHYSEITDDIYYKDMETEASLKTSVYSWFQTLGFKKVSNIIYEDILPSYKKIKDNNKICYRANNDLLMMILAYDETNNKNLLESTRELCEWLISNNPNEVIYKINLFQIKKRQSDLQTYDRKELLSILQETKDNMIKVACNLLLDNIEQAEFFFEKLTSKEQECFNTFPISIYRKQKNI